MPEAVHWIRDADGRIRFGEGVDPEDRALIRDGAVHFLDPIGLGVRPSVDLMGVKTIGTKRVYKLLLAEEEGGERIIFVDSQSYLELRETRRFRAGGLEFRAEIDLADHKKVNGVMFPFRVVVRITSRSKGLPTRMVMNLTAVWINPEIPDSRFTSSSD